MYSKTSHVFPASFASIQTLSKLKFFILMLISQHPCNNGVSARARKSNAGQGQARQTKSNREKQIRV
jgi:hypothetical protein